MNWVSERDLAANAGVRLFCLPHAGSGAAGFYRWKRLLPESIAVCPILLPGREARLGEPSMLNVTKIVAALHAEVRDQLKRPYALFGHSMSALIAFEWARLIQREGLLAPKVLFVSGRDAPQKEFGHREFHKMADEEMVHALVEKYGGDARVVLEDADLREVFVPILRADLTVVETYRLEPGDKLTCSVRSYAGMQDASVSDAGLLGWGELSSGRFASRRIAGDHFFHLGVGQGELLGELSRELES